MPRVSFDELKILISVSVDISMILESADKHAEVPAFLDMCRVIQASDRTKGIQIRTMVQYLSEKIGDLE